MQWLGRRIIHGLIISTLYVPAYAADGTSNQIQMLNSQLQVQMQRLHETQQKQIKELNQKLQGQLKETQEKLQAEIKDLHKKTEEKMKKMQEDLQAQIKQVHEEVLTGGALSRPEEEPAKAPDKKKGA